MSNEIEKSMASFGDDIEYMSFSFTPLIDGMSSYPNKAGKTVLSTGDSVTIANINPTKNKQSALGNVPFGIGLYIHEQQMLHRSVKQNMTFWLNIKSRKTGEVTITPVSSETAEDMLNV